MSPDSPDLLLNAYLAARDPDTVEGQLGRLLDEVARPIIRRVVASVLRDAADAEDVVSDTLADLLRRLRDLRAGNANPIQDLRGYVVTCAYNACHERLRERYPARNRLRNHLQYLFGHHPKYALWRAERGVMICGRNEWHGRDAVSAEHVELAARSDPTAEDRAQIGKLVEAALRATNGPIELDALVAAIARAIGLEQQRVEVPLATIEHTAAAPADTSLEERVTLRELWDDVRQLAAKQRAALLLNLRDVHGRECLSLLPLTRTATIAEIAAAVEMPLERFAALWNELPLSDARIAELLDLEPRQVIKLRRLARERLRRMEKSRTRRNTGTESGSSLATMGRKR